MKDKPLISVLIPVYNGESFLPKCLDSVLNQTYKNIEIICINDGSKDNSLKILKQYSKKDKRIKLISRENKGDHETRRELLNNINGEYFIFMDDDDYIDSKTIETAYNTLIKENCDMVEYNVNHIYLGHRNTNYAINHFGKFLNKKYINYFSLVLWNKLFKTSIFKKYKNMFPKNKNITCVFDKWFCFEYLTLCKNVYALKDKFYTYIIRNSSTLSNMNYDKILSDFYSMNEVFKFLDKNKLFRHFYKDFFYRVNKLKIKLDKKCIFYKDANKQLKILDNAVKKKYFLIYIKNKINYMFYPKKILSAFTSLDGNYRITSIFGIRIKKKKNITNKK